MDTYQQNPMSNDLTKTKPRLFYKYVFWLLKKIGLCKAVWNIFFPYGESRQISSIVNSVADKHQSRKDRTTTIEALFHDFKR